MSGDAGGLVAALVLAPVALAGAAVAGIAYGTIKVGGFLVGAAVDYAQKKRAEKELVVNNCSVELEGLYKNMQFAIQQQADAFQSLSVQTQRKLQKAAEELQAQADDTSAPDMETLNKTISDTHATINKAMASHAAEVKSNILVPGRKQLMDCAKALEKVGEAKAALVDWRQQSISAQAQQKAVAYESLRDAIASINMMCGLASVSRNEGFRQQYEALREACDVAQKHFDSGLYETSFSGSRTVIRQVAMSVAAQQADQMELDFAAMQLQAKMEGLIDEMNHRRHIHIPAGPDCDEALDEDLDEYSQGQYSKTQVLLSEKLNQIRNPANLYEVDKMAQEYEAILEPRALKVMEVSQQVMQGYHEKLRVLDVVSEFMESQNYTMDWAAPVGDDLSQKLVVHFVNNISKSSISVTLDNRSEAGDIAKMAMEVLTFYNNGNEVSEEEKKQLRDDLNVALRQAGVMGGVSCQGQVNMPSSQPHLNTEDGVLNETPRRIL